MYALRVTFVTLVTSKSATTTPPERYLYNGKELNNDLGLEWYDYGARYFDAAIGRWGQVDPLAAPQASYSPYHYTYDNPISYWDPFGLFGSEKKAEKKRKKAVRKLGEDRVEEVYYNEEKDTVYKKWWNASKQD